MTNRNYPDESDGLTLKEVVDRACKPLDIGCAVLPKPLFQLDVDEIQEHEENDNDVGGQSDSPKAADGSGEYREELPRSYSFSKTTLYSRVLQHEFNSIVIEHHLKWTPLCITQPGPMNDGNPSDRLGRYDFFHTDQLVDWALQRNMKVKGHVLVWHVTSPVSILETMSPQQVSEQVRRHIFTTMGHFRGRIQVWDVVNESLAPDGTLAKNVFYNKMGPNYIEQCFRWAHEADPSAILLYNDNKVEGLGSRKAEGFYQLLKDLKQRNVPIHGCGMQAHFNAAGVGETSRVPTPRMVKEQIRRCGNLGLQVNISEMDVRVSQLPVHLRQLAQRQIYHDIIAAALTEPAFDGIWLWGFTDRHTWVTHFYYDDEPLILNDDYERKEAYYGLREALQSIVPGGTVGGNVILDSDNDDEGRPWGYQWLQQEAPSGDESVLSCSKDDLNDCSGDSRPDWLQS